MTDTTLFDARGDAAARRQLERPPTLRRICSISCGLPARTFIQLLRNNKVTTLLDTRITREYRGIGFATVEDDFRYLCELAGVRYIVAEMLAPTRGMREHFANTFKDPKKEADRDPQAWTHFLEEYERLLQTRRVLRDQELRSILYGTDEAVAITCACRHHLDCHRSFACGLLTTVLPDVELRVLYNGKEPRRENPRRYRLKEFPWAALPVELPRGGAR